MAELKTSRTIAFKAPSSIFCDHSWRFDPLRGIDVCEHCLREKLRGGEIAEPSPMLDGAVLSYDQSLHDNRYYFPNRCYACKEYVNTEGCPSSGTDLILCNIGGEVEVQNGCEHFEPDSTASCQMAALRTCWNHSFTDAAHTQSHCAVYGQLWVRSTGACPSHVCRERTEIPFPVASDCTEVSRSYKHVLRYPEGGTPTRIKIIDAMKENGIGMCIKVDECCRNCKYESHKMQDLGYCSFHEISLLCYFGSNPYGYDDKACINYARKPTLPRIIHSKILITASTLGEFTLSDDLMLVGSEITLKINDGVRMENRYSIADRASGETLTKIDPHLLQSVQYDPKDRSVHINYIDKSVKFNPNLGTLSEPATKKSEDATWINSVSETDWEEALRTVQFSQREHGVFSGTPNSNCEACKHVYRDFKYPSGSPTGLVCGRKSVFVTANAKCDDFVLILRRE